VTGLGAEGAPTFRDRWLEAVAARGEAVFLRHEAAHGGVAEWSYAGWDAVVAEVAGGLQARGVRAGDRVHVTLANCPAFVALWLACVRIGAVLVPSDPRAAPRELAVHRGMVEPVLSIGHASTEADQEIEEEDAELHALRGPAADDDDIVPGALDPAAILFTSGTTSAPKGVVITQANYAWAGDVMAAAATVRAEDRLLVVLPLFHANAQYYSFAAAISAGASVALIHRFSAGRFFTQAAAHRATHASLFAAPMRMILARDEEPRYDVRLRHVWYAQNLVPEHLERFSRLAGCRPRQLYGMTETVPAVLTQRALDHATGVLGGATVGCRVALAEDGELLVGGRPGYEVFLEYLDDAEATERAFDGEWFATGDLAALEGSAFRFAGRRGEVLKVAGENVSTVEVEAILAGHPSVHEVAVVGRPDPIRDEVPIAYVVLAAGETVEPEALLGYAAERLAPAKRPRDLHLVDELPRTSVGKIRKFLLTAEATEA